MTKVHWSKHRTYVIEGIWRPSQAFTLQNLLPTSTCYPPKLATDSLETVEDVLILAGKSHGQPCSTCFTRFLCIGHAACESHYKLAIFIGYAFPSWNDTLSDKRCLAVYVPSQHTSSASQLMQRMDACPWSCNSLRWMGMCFSGTGVWSLHFFRSKGALEKLQYICYDVDQGRLGFSQNTRSDPCMLTLPDRTSHKLLVRRLKTLQMRYRRPYSLILVPCGGYALWWPRTLT